jgi:hypothetical protein
VSCPAHGVVVAAVRWARHGAGHTLGFDQTVAWLATVCAKSAVTDLLRIAWRTGLADRRHRGRPGLGRHRTTRRSARGPHPHRCRRDLLPQRTQVPDRRGRSRHRPPGLGRSRRGQGRPCRVLRPARTRALRPAHPHLQRCRRLDPGSC